MHSLPRHLAAASMALSLFVAIAGCGSSAPAASGTSTTPSAATTSPAPATSGAAPSAAAPSAAAPSAPAASATAPSSSAAPAAAPSTAPPAAKAPAKLIPIKIAYTASGSAYGPLYVADALGIFKKDGLDATVVYANSSSQAVPILVSGSANIVEGSGDTVLRAATKGVTNLRIFGDVIPTGFLEWWVQPGINTPKDLIGKTIGSTSPGSLGDLQTSVWLAQNGIQRSQVKVVYLGGLSNLTAAMKSKRIDATLILPPLGEPLQAAGAHKLGDLRSMKYASIVDMASASYLKANPQAITDFLKAQAEAISILDTQPNVVLPILAKYTKTTDATANQYAYTYYKPLWQINPTVDQSVLVATVNAIGDPALKKLTLSNYIDNTYAQQIAASGYFSSLPTK